MSLTILSIIAVTFGSHPDTSIASNHSIVPWFTVRSKYEILSHGPRYNSAPSSVSERRIHEILSQMGFEESKDYFHETQFTWLRYRYYDFVLPKIKLIIEFDGAQHFRVSRFYPTVQELKKAQEIDILKTRMALENGYIMVRIDYAVNLNQVLDFIQHRIFDVSCRYFQLIVSNPQLYKWLKWEGLVEFSQGTPWLKENLYKVISIQEVYEFLPTLGVIEQEGL